LHELTYAVAVYMNKSEQAFVDLVWHHYEKMGRHTLPWRRTRDPYKIFVSEVMLQQTQVDRVIPKYKDFLKKFPTIKKLAKAPLGDVLMSWQGLGYNRRAKYLHDCANCILNEHGSKFPKTVDTLKELPGVGQYTAGAIMTFAYNKSVPIIETNIRTVYLHHFFRAKENVSDQEILKKIERTMDTNNPRIWFAALMDYGAYLKTKFGNQNARSKHYSKQSAFKNSDRQIRGAIIKLLSNKKMTRNKLHRDLQFEAVRLEAQLKKLKKEGMITRAGESYMLP